MHLSWAYKQEGRGLPCNVLSCSRTQQAALQAGASVKFAMSTTNALSGPKDTVSTCMYGVFAVRMPVSLS